MSFFDSLPLVLGDPAVVEALRRRAPSNEPTGTSAGQQYGTSRFEVPEVHPHAAAQKLLAKIRQQAMGGEQGLVNGPLRGNQAGGNVESAASGLISGPGHNAWPLNAAPGAWDAGTWSEGGGRPDTENAPIRLSTTAPDYAAVPGATGGSGRTYGFSVDDLVEADKPIFMADGTPVVIGGGQGEQPSFHLKTGIAPERFLFELNSRAEGELGFTPDSARRFKEQTGQEPVGRFFQGADPRNATLNAGELLKSLRVGPDGKAIFQMVVPPASATEYENFLAPQKQRERAETEAIIERERANAQASSVDRAAHSLIRNAPIIGGVEDIWPEAGRNLRQAAEEATRRGTLGWIDPTLGGKAQSDRYNTTGATVGGIVGGIVPVAGTAAALTAIGQPELIPLAVGAQPLVERRPEEKAYDWQQRSLEGLAQGGTMWAAGVIPTAGGFFRTLAAQQVPFVGGPYLTTPFIAKRFPTVNETAQQAALGLVTPLVRRALGRGAGQTIRPGEEEIGERAESGTEGQPTRRSVETYLRVGRDPNWSSYPGALTISKFHGLTTEQRAMEARLAHYAETHVDQILTDYRAKNTRNGVLMLATDLMREHMPGYSESQQSRAENTMSTQTPAGALVATLWKRVLNESGRTNRVVFTGGGAGAGKTSSLNRVLGELHAGSMWSTKEQ